MKVNVNVIGGEICDAEKQAYIDYGKKKYPDRIIREVTVQLDGDFVNLKFDFLEVPFDRIRRITGYLVGTLDRFNDGKRAEEHDRVKHGVEVSDFADN